MRCFDLLANENLLSRWFGQKTAADATQLDSNARMLGSNANDDQKITKVNKQTNKNGKEIRDIFR